MFILLILMSFISACGVVEQDNSRRYISQSQPQPKTADAVVDKETNTTTIPMQTVDFNCQSQQSTQLASICDHLNAGSNQFGVALYLQQVDQSDLDLADIFVTESHEYENVVRFIILDQALDPAYLQSLEEYYQNYQDNLFIYFDTQGYFQENYSLLTFGGKEGFLSKWDALSSQEEWLSKLASELNELESIFAGFDWDGMTNMSSDKWIVK